MPHEPAPCVCFIGMSDVKLWGMTPAERMLKLLAPHGIGNVVSEDDLKGSGPSVILIRADAVLDVPIVPLLIGDVGLVLLGEETATERPVAVHSPPEHAAEAAKILVDGNDRVPVYFRAKMKRPGELDASYWKALRKRENPYALTIGRDNARSVEWRSFMGTYKGATDVVTKHLWPWPAFHVTRWIAPTAITPNLVTALSAVCVVLAFWLFMEAHWALGLAAAWAMTFLDTVDGKLARVTLTSSKWGNVFDHGIDLVHPPFWYAAWAVGLGATEYALEAEYSLWILGAIIAGYILQRLMEGAAIAWLGLEIHIWRRIDTLFRQITARRNPNLVIMTVSAIIGRPDWGLIAVAAWTVLCLVLHGLQLLQAFVAKSRGGNLQSWMNQQAGTS